MNTTYVCGYWHINNFKKKSISDYKKLLRKTFTLLTNCRIIFICDDINVKNYVASIVKTNHIIYVKKTISKLETYNIANDYLLSCKKQDNKRLQELNTNNEKGLIHYQREYKNGGERVFREAFTIWTSKILLVNEMMAHNHFNSDYFAWIDAGVSRFNRTPSLYTMKYPNSHTTSEVI